MGGVLIVKTILSQNGWYLVNPQYVEIYEDGFIFARMWEGDKGSVCIGKYKSRERAEEVLREMFQVDYYEMPLE